jgi:PAS domain S-box-containing protein
MAELPEFSEVFFRAALEAAPSGLMVADARGTIVLVNREVERLTGYTREELLGQPVELLVPEAQRAHHPAHRAQFGNDPTHRAMAAGRELGCRRKDGREVPVEIGLVPVRAPEGLFIISSIVDLSARKVADQRFRAAVERAPTGVLLTSETGAIVLVNREVERMFGYDRSELLAMQVEELLPERFRAPHGSYREGFSKHPQPRSMGAGRSLFGLRKGGGEFAVEIGLNPIETDAGVCVLASIVDVSIREAGEARRRELEGQLRQAQKLEAVGTLAGGIAHDINNVFGAILGFADLIATEPQTDQAQSDLRELAVAVGRGRDIVRRILQFSRKQDLSLRPVELGSELRETLQLLRRTLPKSVDLQISVPEGLPQIRADLTSLHQVIVNLATNASHALPHGGTLSITASETEVSSGDAVLVPGLKTGRYVVLEVADDGAGMDRETLARAFEPFFTTKRQGEGTGLGLSMVRTLLQAHGGAVSLSSEPGLGTQARCWFPAIERQEKPTEVAEAEIPRGRGEQILVVDDEPVLLQLAVRNLTALGYQVRGTGDPQEALRWIAEDAGGLRLLVTDYAMPKMNGLELAAAAHALRPGLPILMETGYASNAPRGELQRAGIRALLAKPATARERALALRDALDKAR